MVNRYTFLILICLLSLFTLEARGGGRGGGGRGGSGRSGGRSGSFGSSRGGAGRIASPSMSRSRGAYQKPQMARPSQRPAQRQAQRPSMAQRPTARPATRQGQGGAATRSQVQNFLKQSGNVSNRTSQLNRSQLQQTIARRENVGNNIRNRVNVNDFNMDWNKHWGDLGWDRGDLLRGATWAAVAGWGSWGWSEPYYYDYAAGNPYYYTVPESSTVSQTYTAPQTPVAPQSATTQTANQEWLPLGTYAITKDANVTSTPSHYLQLALGKDGSIKGVFANRTTNKSYDVEGMVDTQTQIAAWKQVDNDNSPVMETGLYNLTQDQTPVQINFADGSDQNWLMVRLKG